MRNNVKTKNIFEGGLLGGRYKILQGQDFSSSPSSVSDRALAIDMLKGRCVLLRIFSAEDEADMMREADTVSMLEYVDDSVGDRAYVPEITDAHKAVYENEPVSYLVYEYNKDEITLEKYLRSLAFDPEEAYHALCSAVNTLVLAAKSGVYHGSFNEKSICLSFVGDRAKSILRGFGEGECVDPCADIESAKETLLKIDREVFFGKRRFRKVRKKAMDSIRLLEDVRRVRSERGRLRSVGAISLATCFFALVLSCALVLLRSPIFSGRGGLDVDTPELLGLVYDSYDEDTGQYRFTDPNDKERSLELDGSIYSLDVSSSDEYYFEDGRYAPPSEGAYGEGYVLSQTPSPSEVCRAVPGKSPLKIKIVVFREVSRG